MKGKIMLTPMLVEVKVNENANASRRTKNRVQWHMWLMDVSTPDCMGGKKCGRFQARKSSNHSVINGKSLSCEDWHGWFPLDELVIRKGGKVLDLA